jgi:DNA-binding CsgD family transcriptional regulator
MVEPSRIAKLRGLTKRQRQVLTLRCRGLTFAEIAQEIDREERTVTDHMGNIYERLGIDHLRGTARDLELAEFCRALRELSEEPPAVNDETDDDVLPVPSERALVAVMEDELALVKRPSRAIEPRRPMPIPIVYGGNEGRIPRSRLLPLAVLVGVPMLTAIVAALVVSMVVVARTSPAPQVLPPVVITVVAPTANVASSQADQSRAAASLASPTVAQRPAVAPSPTQRPITPSPAPTPAPTAVPDTVPGSTLAFGDAWQQEDIRITFSTFQFAS